MFKYRDLILFCLSFFFICSCTSSDHPGKTITQMEFNVDSFLVNRKITDSSLRITYSVPSCWKKLIAADSAVLPAQPGGIKVRQILQNPVNSVVFSVTDVREVPDSVFRKLDKDYKTVLNPAGRWNSINRADFVTDGFDVNQFILSKPGSNHFKLLFAEKGRPLFQLDYAIIIDSSYTLNTKTLESIIGSLHRDY